MIAQPVSTTQIVVRLAGLVVLLFASQAHASNFAECILDRMPGASNHATNNAVWQACSQKHADRYFAVKKGSGRGLFGFADGNACTIKKAGGTTHNQSASVIAYACRCLYDKPDFEGEMCSYRTVQGETFGPWEAYRK